MTKAIKWIVKTVIALAAFIVILLVGGFAMLNTSWLQQEMLNRVQTALTEKLQTKIEIDSVSIDLLTLDAKLYGLCVEDRQQRKMLQLGFLKADVDVMALLYDEVRVEEVKIEGVKAELHKVPKDSLSPDTIANFQFVIDVFKADKKKQKTDSIKPKPKGGKKTVTFIMNKLTAKYIDVAFNQDSIHLGSLQYTQPRHGSPKGKIEHLKGRWERYNKKGELVTNEAEISLLEYTEQDGQRLADLKRLHFKTNNHRPRKNASKPKRGFFDVGHFNIWADLKLAVDRIEKGTVHGWLRECTARDTISGIDIRKLQCEVTANKDGMRLEDVQIQQGEGTQLHFVRGDLHFPNKKKGTKLSYFTSTIGGKVVLKDISRTFAPVLSHFTLPLTLSVRMEGDGEGMRFRDVNITRPNGMLNIKASGYITGLKNKYDLKVHFDVHETTVKDGEKERLINQFVVKKFMMKQLDALGTIHYTGSFNVVWKKEEFQGTLRTEPGIIKFYFALDENNKYVIGHASTPRLNIGQVMDMPDIGPVAASADFKIDISKPRTAMMRRKLGGKLPICEITAHVDTASYKFIKVTNADVKIVSNGAIAEGYLKAPGKLADLSCTFSFTNTNEMKKTKIKPGIRFHLFDKDDEETKLKKQAEKEARKAAKEEEKAARKAAKAEKKAAKAAEKGCPQSC